MLDKLFPSSEIIEVDQASDVADVVASASVEQRPVYPVGGGTSLGLGALATEPGAILSLGKLNRLIDYPSKDLTITVEAGITMAKLATHLAAENQRLPIDVGAAGAATVGGVVAANLSGPRRYRFGTMRDYLLGCERCRRNGEGFFGGWTRGEERRRLRSDSLDDRIARVAGRDHSGHVDGSPPTRHVRFRSRFVALVGAG